MTFPSLRTLVFTLLLLTIVATFTLVLLIRQLDLDGYRQTLEDKLSVALQQPVSVGRSSLTYKNGIALELRNLQIGPETALIAEIPRLIATLEIAPLLEKKLILDHVQIENPKLQLWLPLENRPSRGTAHNLADTLGIRVLSITNASLRLHLQQKKTAKQLLELHNLHAVMRGWGSAETGQLAISGQVQQPTAPADFILNISLPSKPDPDTWRLEKLSYQFSFNNFSTTTLPKAVAARLPGKINGSLSFQGAPAAGTKLYVSIKDQLSAEELISLSGNWSSSPEQDTISKLQGNLLGIPLSGQFKLQRKEKSQHLAGSFGVKNLQLTPQLLQRWRINKAEELMRGKLDRLELTLKKTWPKDKPFSSMPEIGAELSLCSIEWSDPDRPQLQDFTLKLAIDDKRLKISDGLLILAGQLAEFSGQIDNPFSQPQLNLAYQLTPKLERVNKLVKLPTTLQMSGPVAITGRLNGTPARPEISLSADFSRTHLEFKNLLYKTPAKTAALKLEGVFYQNQLQLNQLLLNLDRTSISAQGQIPLKVNKEPYRLDIDLINLAALQSYSPLLKKIALQGFTQATLMGQSNKLDATLQLDEVGATFNNIVGDLSNATGTIQLDQQGLSFKQLQADLGDSHFILTGNLADWKNPQLDLALQSDKVRAQDLIFPNRQLTLYDLNGKLQINKSGINFAPVHVRLENNTQATVTGKLENFADPLTSLSISSDQADILDIINLFSGPRKTRPANPNRIWKPLTIEASVKQGTLGGLNFQNAKGTIVDHKGVFTIYPLTFENGEGFCMTRVEFDRNHTHGLLKVSGHAENIDASILHKEVFKKRGLIDGKLRGDFYIEGTPKDNRFWHTAVGGIYLQVKQGTLRKFHGLAKVFSLLNVSQLIVGKLPDMNKDGMPFSILEGSLKIFDGQARTEDIRVQSEAMNLSLVGEQSLIDNRIDYSLGVMPLRTVDKVITSIPIAGWVLAGENKAFLTAHFKIEGNSDNPKVSAVPMSSVSGTVFGILKRSFGLPGKLVKDLGSIFKTTPNKKQGTTE